MMRRRVLAAFLLACVALAAGLAILPARWIMAIVPSHWPLTVVDAEGTVWSGKATLAIGPEHQRRRLPDALRWTWSFLQGPKIELDHPWFAGPITVAATPAGALVSSQTLSLPAETLAMLDARLNAISPGGRLTVKWPTLALGWNGPVAGTPLLEAEWRDAASALAPIRPLGHYTLTLMQQADNTARLTLSSQSGPLLMEGTGKLTAGHGLLFEGQARAAPTAAPEVRAALLDLLSALGPRQNDLTLLYFH